MKSDPTAIVAGAVKSGVLVRRPCRECGATKVEAHHTDYSKPLDVVWLCRAHHVAEHKRLKQSGMDIKHREVIPSTVIHLRVSPNLVKRVRKLAETQQRTTTNMARVLLEEATNGK